MFDFYLELPHVRFLPWTATCSISTLNRHMFNFYLELPHVRFLPWCVCVWFLPGTATYNQSADMKVLHQDGCWVLAKWGGDEWEQHHQQKDGQDNEIANQHPVPVRNDKSIQPWKNLIQNIPYSGKLSREKTFADWWNIRFSRRKLSRIARFCCAKGRHTPNIGGVNFRESPQNLKSFPLYGNMNFK